LKKVLENSEEILKQVKVALTRTSPSSEELGEQLLQLPDLKQYLAIRQYVFIPMIQKMLG